MQWEWSLGEFIVHHEHTEIVLLTVFICEFWHNDSGCSFAEGAEAQPLACFGSQNHTHGLHKTFLMHIKNRIASVLVLPVLASFNVP